MATDPEDDRFAVVRHDPRFDKIPQDVRKVKIDQRFHSMFKDDSFRLKFSMDRRGRPVNLSSDKHLRKFYELSSSEDESSSDEGDDDGANDAAIQPEVKKRKRMSGKEKLHEELRKRKAERTLKKPSATGKPTKAKMKSRDLQDEEVSEAVTSVDLPAPSSISLADLARGQGNVESSSDSDSDYASTDGEEGRDEPQWGEMDQDARRSCHQSARMALCNMDWDRVTAADLLVLLSSFKPSGGVIHSVKIYPSDYGLDKMREEDARGPAGIIAEEGKNLMDSSEHQLQEKLRKYQVQRLKYYYGVIVCDSVDTASAIYDHCDGIEYQTSSTTMDLRFIADDVTFDRDPKEIASEMPDYYKSVEFQTTALHHSRVELTWDETSHHRILKTSDAFTMKTLEEMDVSTFLASSSDEEADDNYQVDLDESNGQGQMEDDEETAAPLSEDQQIRKYRALLEETDKVRGEDEQMQMEITWEPGLKVATAELVKKVVEDATPWEKFLDKKKEKKKRTKKTRKALKNQETDPPADDPSKAAFSDDDLPAQFDPNDEFFKANQLEPWLEGKKTKQRTGKKSVETNPAELAELKHRESQLELLFMENDGKKHFNLKSIIENEEKAGKKSKRKHRKREQPVKFVDDFNIDVKDDRFQAMFTSHLYALDPSDPLFKKTKATDVLIAERQRQRADVERDGYARATRTVAKPNKNVELSMLVKSVKSKTDQFQARKLNQNKAR